MANDLIYVRVLQHDTEDMIRIGMATPVWNNQLDKVVDDVKAGYEKELSWCGGLEKGCDRFYKRIALVDAKTLAVVKVIWQRKDKESK